MSSLIINRNKYLYEIVSASTQQKALSQAREECTEGVHIATAPESVIARSKLPKTSDLWNNDFITATQEILGFAETRYYLIVHGEVALTLADKGKSLDEDTLRMSYGRLREIIKGDFPGAPEDFPLLKIDEFLKNQKQPRDFAVLVEFNRLTKRIPYLSVRQRLETQRKDLLFSLRSGNSSNANTLIDKIDSFYHVKLCANFGLPTGCPFQAGGSFVCVGSGTGRRYGVMVPQWHNGFYTTASKPSEQSEQWNVLLLKKQ